MNKFSFIYLGISLLLFLLMGCGPHKVEEEEVENSTNLSTDTTGNIKTEVDNTDTDSLYRGY